MLAERLLTQKGCSESDAEQVWLSLMPEAELKHSLNAVKRAGKILRKELYTWDELIESQKILEDWQACHSYPLKTFYDSLLRLAQEKSPLTNVVQRRKTLDAIVKKLRREPRNQLSTMQDIAGCRAIVKSINDIEPFVSLCRAGWADHELFDVDDYIKKPSASGYRGIHYIYRFKSENRSFNDRFVEVQFRTRAQHAWATAVEIVDLFEKQSLKTGQGDPAWQRFFVLTGSAMAELESSPLVPGAPGRPQLEAELRQSVETLKVVERMRAYQFASRVIRLSVTRPEIPSYYFLLELNENYDATIRHYSEDEAAKAYKDVADAEQDGRKVVLVAASDFEGLKEAYPNWLIDTHNFEMLLKFALGNEMSW